MQFVDWASLSFWLHADHWATARLADTQVPLCQDGPLFCFLPVGIPGLYEDFAGVNNNTLHSRPKLCCSASFSRKLRFGQVNQFSAGPLAEEAIGTTLGLGLLLAPDRELLALALWPVTPMPSGIGPQIIPTRQAE